MLKRICDRCKAELPSAKIDEQGFRITRTGFSWDLCQECQKDLEEWLKGVQA